MKEIAEAAKALFNKIIAAHKILFRGNSLES